MSKVGLKIGFFTLLLGVIVFIALGVGKYTLTPENIGSLITQWLVGDEVQDTAYTVFWHIRLPRVLAAIVIGAGLSIAGAAYQGMFRNPLVSPDILGVSSGAALGALIAIFLDFSILHIQLFAFIGGVAVVTLVYSLARFARRHDPVLSMVLIGIAIGTLCGAGASLLKVLADPYTQLPTITFWLLGGLSTTTLADLASALPVMFCGLLPLILLRWRMNLLSLPDEEAQALGVNVQRNRIIFILSATLITASAVSISGIIGWVGLVIPHISRLIIGPNFARLLPLSVLLGAAFLLLTDTLARTIAPIELPLGVLTSCIGAPFFLMLLMRTGRRA